ncbi:beta-ketoacyl-[acyl-carrier-protein] synthase family protein [Cellulomonas shaoxiangyii]|uniref:Beta-ketoacyl-[acyl-carrier-protein] synthase family protein n=2 Tax=Cellulomonas shaoxiangyii TaxID=2566013 RepID=A0A4P7SLG9_9CELL|nr:beta-ketoacyl-[acyl-carrier-protein] synthase family protein [Cellulomonas shaoxiangyii]TGY78201.1 beta-ketoacyl-[acyl-carrier-protein] synthase family protein [Cellulomonas shaoxiangyii]
MGRGVDALLAGLREGRDCARPVTAFDTTGFAHAQGCEVPEGALHTPAGTGLGRAAAFAVDATLLALQDAGLEASALRSVPVAVAVGTTDGESRDLDDIVGLEVAGATGDGSAVLARRVQPLRLSAAVARHLELERAEVLTLQTACAAGNYAIGYGYDAIVSGDVEIALTGGADALCRKTFTGFYRLGTIAPDVCRPFDADREGILTGEGGAVLVLETLASARARGARPYAEVLGYGLACDAAHPVAPDVAGVARTIRTALDRAGLEPADVDLVSAHGTGTRANDVTEVGALREVYGDALPRTVSIKSMLGHAMGAASALGAASSALALRHQFVPPTINHRTTDPACAVDCQPNVSAPAALDVVQNHGLAFGGNNSVVLFARVDRGTAA